MFKPFQLPCWKIHSMCVYDLDETVAETPEESCLMSEMFKGVKLRRWKPMLVTWISVMNRTCCVEHLRYCLNQGIEFKISRESLVWHGYTKHQVWPLIPKSSDGGGKRNGVTPFQGAENFHLYFLFLQCLYHPVVGQCGAEDLLKSFRWTYNYVERRNVRCGAENWGGRSSFDCMLEWRYFLGVSGEGLSFSEVLLECPP